MTWAKAFDNFSFAFMVVGIVWAIAWARVRRIQATNTRGLPSGTAQPD